MKNKNGNLQRAIRKIKRYNDRQFGGYLTPCEIIAIMDNGGVVTDYGKSFVGYAEKHKKHGTGNPFWFYFTIRPNSTLANLLGEAIADHAHDKRG